MCVRAAVPCHRHRRTWERFHFRLIAVFRTGHLDGALGKNNWMVDGGPGADAPWNVMVMAGEQEGIGGMGYQSI